MTIGSVIAVTPPMAAPTAGGAQTESMRMAPDFSSVKTRAGAEARASKGELVKVLLFPQEFGGEDIPENTIFVTPQAAAAKERITGTLMRFVREGLIDQLDVMPEYKGESFVPSRIVMKATHSAKAGGFSPTIEIW